MELTLDTIKDNLNVGNNSTFVSLMDSESKNMENIMKAYSWRSTKSLCSGILFNSYNGNRC